mmetsp:Transcript_25867/g.43088  ORF Transcript_25867/g.43088 Transcript_25867/m.43088 type:complete len:212 (-) Transcript_25867:708-1343(-)
MKPILHPLTLLLESPTKNVACRIAMPVLKTIVVAKMDDRIGICPNIPMLPRGKRFSNTMPWMSNCTNKRCNNFSIRKWHSDCWITMTRKKEMCPIKSKEKQSVSQSVSHSFSQHRQYGTQCALHCISLHLLNDIIRCPGLFHQCLQTLLVGFGPMIGYHGRCHFNVTQGLHATIQLFAINSNGCDSIIRSTISSSRCIAIPHAHHPSWHKK